MKRNKFILILTGPVHTGKSEALLHWVKDKSVAGFITPLANSKKVLFDISTAQYYTYESGGSDEHTIAVGKYFLNKHAFETAIIIANTAIAIAQSSCFVLDEIGKLELAGQGHYQVIHTLLAQWHGDLLLVVREQLIEEVIKSFPLHNYTIISRQQLNNYHY